jgi:hypothetical protein
VVRGEISGTLPRLVSTQPVARFDRMNRRVGLVIVPAVARPVEAPRLQRPGEGAPLWVVCLCSHQSCQVEALLKLICLSPGVGQVSLLVQPLRYLHGSVRRNAQTAGSLLLQLDRAERRRPPPLLLVPIHARHHRHPTLHAHLIQNQRALTVKQPPTAPDKECRRLLLGRDLGALPMLQLDLPEILLRGTAGERGVGGKPLVLRA